MNPTENIEKSSPKSLLQHFPRAHAVMLGLLSAGLGICAMLPSPAESTARQIQSINIPAVAKTLPDINQDAAAELDSLLSAPVNFRISSQEVKAGDSLSLLFKRAGLSDRDMMALLQSTPEAKKLGSMVPGHNVSFQILEDGSLNTLTYVVDELNSFSYQREDSGTYTYSEISRTPELKWATREGTIEQSLYAAGLRSGLDDKLIMELADIFGWDVDFALDIRKGDHFKVLFEEKYLDGEKLGSGAILSAEFTNQGHTYAAVRYVDEEGRPQYYNPDGKNMRKAFLLAPVDFRRISDGFNPRRLHPVTKVVKPHRGIDYAAATGTPVWSSGDGKVIAASYSSANGNYVVVQHGNNVQTKYLHLSKRYVKLGQKVRQKQVIGAVGSTGLATGPHLHYEFLLNGVHRNPRTIVQTLPKAESIENAKMERFLAQTQPLVAALESPEQAQATRLALKENDTTTSL